MRYTHWFWDFDGTLFDTYPLAVRTFQKGLRELGIGVSDTELLRRMKITLRHAAASFDGGRLEEELMAAFDRNDVGVPPSGLPLYPGAIDMLRAIAARGGKHYLYTHRDRSAMLALESKGLWTLFTDAVTREDDFPSKPAPDALQYLMDKHSLHPADCCMVGDRPIDIEAGKNAGMDSILFDADGFYPDYPAAHRFTDYMAFLAALPPLV